MSEMNEKEGKLYALLIGVDYYAPNPLFGHLHGCVRDVERVEAFFRKRLNMTDSQIKKLTASHDGKGGVIEPVAQQPTYKNIADAFNKLRDTVKAGDQVYIHYSGHGGRAKTIYPDVRSGKNPVDEGFAPTNIGQGGNYFRDLQLAKVLNDMADKGAFVSVFLDCCHSGGMTRGTAVARGINEVDMTDRSADSVVGNVAELTSTWNELAGAATRGSVVGLPETKRWVVLAACRPQQSAYEFAFDGENKSGALTYFSLDVLKAAGSQMTYQQLHQRVMSRINSQFSRQMPQLFGDGSRIVFGTDRIESAVNATVMSIKNGKVKLQIGAAQGVTVGSLFAVERLDGDDAADSSETPIVKLTEVGATQSVGIVESGDIAEIAQGASAVLTQPGSHKLIRHVHIQQAREEDALPAKAVSAIVAAHDGIQDGGFIRFVDNAGGKDKAVEFIVCHDPDRPGHYLICDAVGDPLPKITPALAIDTVDSAEKVVKRLIHLAKYFNVRDLVNNDRTANRRIKIGMGWADGLPTDHTFAPGDEPSFVIRNDSSSELSLSVIKLGVDWSIEQIYPDDEASYDFQQSETDTIAFAPVTLDVGTTSEIDYYKLFATKAAADFRMLQLPTLDTEHAETDRYTLQKTRSGGSLTPLEQLLSQFTEQASPTRSSRLKTSAGSQWNTVQLMLTVENKQTEN